jgi:hypothetical protein
LDLVSLIIFFLAWMPTAPGFEKNNARGKFEIRREAARVRSSDPPLVAHREQSSICERLVSGLENCPCGLRDTFPDFHPVVNVAQEGSSPSGSSTVAGAAPDFHRLPNYLAERIRQAPQATLQKHAKRSLKSYLVPQAHRFLRQTD